MLKQLYPIFRKWSEKGSVYVYSDPHFEDADCKLMSADWPSPQEQVKLINSIVHKNDTLIILGDIGNTKYIADLKAGYKVLVTGNHDVGASKYEKDYLKIVVADDDPEYADIYEDDAAIVRKLKEKHPRYKFVNMYEQYQFVSPFVYKLVILTNNLFDEVYTGPLFIGDKILLSHEPIDLPFALNIHGHVHDDEHGGCFVYDQTHNSYKYNVCSNTIEYKPINLKDIVNSGRLKNINDIHRITIDKATAKKGNK